MSDAKRFGGAHSPDNSRRAPPAAAPGRQSGGGPKPSRPPSRLSGRKVRSFSWRVLGLYIAPTGLLLSGLWGLFGADPSRVLTSLAPWGVLMLAAWLTGQGLKAEAAFNERIIAKPPAFPRKMVAAGLIGAAVAAASIFAADLNVVISAVYGALAAGAHVTVFGLDPMRAKGVAGVNDAELERVAAKLDEAEAVVAETVAAADGLRDRKLTDRIDSLAYAARDILREIQSDPRDLRRSRRFLSVYLAGLRDATVKYAAANAKGAATEMRGEYEGLLTDLEASFAKHRQTLLIDDQTDLEVEIEVLRDRLKQEGAV